MNYDLDLNTHLLKKKESPKKYWYYVKKNNLLGTAITEYSNLNPGKAYKLLLESKPKNKVLIPGVTINTDIGEVIILAPDAELYNYGLIYESKISIKRIIDFCNMKNYIVSIAHPYGLISNSATYILGLSKLENLIKTKNIGIEAYSGIIGYLSYYLYDSLFLRKLKEFLDFFNLHKMFRAIGLSNISGYITRQLDQKCYDLVYKFEATTKLAKLAKFVTAGSAGFSADTIGSGILSISLPKSIIEEKNEYKKNKFIINKIRYKKIVNVGPPGRYTESLFERSTARKTKRKAYNDLMYLTRRSFK